MQTIEPEIVDVTPVKSFFVSMLTRDIKLEEAILDLLDNCVDGILRNKSQLTEKPYEGSWAEITFDSEHFSITDNCGGIPLELRNYALKFGRDRRRKKDPSGVIGVYGIGMKRAIFKMGNDTVISTRSRGAEYEVEITPEWVQNDDDWEIQFEDKPTNMIEDGTSIVVGDLHPAASARFGVDQKSFQSELNRLIATHYALIIAKGFRVTVNGEFIEPRFRQLIFDDSSGRRSVIKPFIYQAKTEKGVEIFITVGFTRPIPSQDEVLDEQTEKRYTSEEAGWTIICNDRAVLFCDRTELTGWGEAGVPRYHTQFIAISGIVEFKSDDPSLLPTTTTKRGVDASSIVYLQAKNKMREGMQLFTNYTNKWKGRAEESQVQIDAGSPRSFIALKHMANDMSLRKVTRPLPEGRQFKPKLPSPPSLEPKRRRISYTKNADDVAAVGQYLLGHTRSKPSEVGEKCFDLYLENASQ